jgi:GPH family glycoside/pentoside/hexuronide:cation symporter
VIRINYNQEHSRLIAYSRKEYPLSEKLAHRTKLVYGCGDIGFSLTTTIIGAYFAIFLTDVVGIAPGIAGLAIFIGRSWDYINDPLVGHLSDRTRTRWGRRRPFLLFGALPFALAFILLWTLPPFENQVLLAIYYAVAYVLFDTAATFVYMPYFALTPELTSNYDERTALTSYRMFFSILGSLIAFTIPLLIIASFRPENSARVLLMGIVFAAVSAAPLLIVFLGTRERYEYSELGQPGFKESLKAAVSNKPFIFGMIIFLLTWVSIDILQTTLLYFIKYVVQRESQSDIIMAVIFVTAMLFLPLWEWISRRWNKRLAYSTGIAFWAAVQIVLVFLNPATAFIPIIILCMMAGIGVSAAHVLPWSIIPDAIEWDEWKTGERHEGIFYSLVTLSQKVASSFAIPLVLLILQITGYVPTAVAQPQSAQLGIRLVIGPIPALLLSGGIIFAILYPLSRESHRRIVQEIEAKRNGIQEEVA